MLASLKKCIAKSKALHETCVMLNVDRNRLQILFTYLFLFLFLSLVLDLSLTIFKICINPFTTSRIAFKHHLVKQINYCYLVLSDIVHVMLYTAQ